MIAHESETGTMNGMTRAGKSLLFSRKMRSTAPQAARVILTV